MVEVKVKVAKVITLTDDLFAMIREKSIPPPETVKVFGDKVDGRLDLTIMECHVCGTLMLRDDEAEMEWCENPRCQVFRVAFHTPYCKGVWVKADGAT